MADPRIYLDYAATAPLLPEVRAAILPWLDSGNPSSLYQEGREAKAAIDHAREVISSALGAEFGEIIFTSGGTEAANLALIGTALVNSEPSRNRILMGAAEHHCVLSVGPLLQRLGYTIELLPVDQEGRVAKAIVEDDVFLVAVMAANNELGTINDVAAISGEAHAAGALMFVDAVQSFGHTLPLPPHRGGRGPGGGGAADLLAISAHKIGGPKGVGALYVKAGTKIKPTLYGGGQEREMRGGTENVAGIVGFAAAVQHWKTPANLAHIRDAFEQRLIEAGAIPTVTTAERLPGHCHVRFPSIDAETMLIRLDMAGISASSGAACSSGSIEPSHVLLACGYPEKEAKEGLRFTMGPGTTEAIAREAATRIVQVVDAIRARK